MIDPKTVPDWSRWSLAGILGLVLLFAVTFATMKWIMDVRATRTSSGSGYSSIYEHGE